MATVFKSDQFEMFTITLAIEKDTPVVIRLLKNSAEWIRQKGMSQWGYLLEGGEDEEIARDIKAGTTYLVKDSDENIVATFNFSSEQNDWDIDMWGKRTDKAHYLHRLAVSENYRHQKIGSRLLRWMDEQSDGLIRLDCVANNPALNELYRNAGFTLIGLKGEGDNTFSLYEKASSTKP